MRRFALTPVLVLALAFAACSDYRDDGPPPAPGPDVDVFVSDGYWYYWDGYSYCYWDGYGYRPWVYGHPNYYYGPRGVIVVGGPRGFIGPHGVLPPPLGGFPHPYLRGGPRGHGPMPGRGARPMPRGRAYHGAPARHEER